MKKTNTAILFVTVATLVVIIDQITKFFSKTASFYINNYLSIQPYYNHGLLSTIAFSEGGVIIIGILLLLVIILKHEAEELKKHDILAMVFLGLAAGAVSSHTLELWIRGEVIDFIAIRTPQQLYATNFADIALLFGLGSFFILSIPHSIGESKKRKHLLARWLLRTRLKNHRIIIAILSIVGSQIIPMTFVKKMTKQRKKVC